VVIALKILGGIVRPALAERSAQGHSSGGQHASLQTVSDALGFRINDFGNHVQDDDYLRAFS
jgi:hypothetical protein